MGAKKSAFTPHFGNHPRGENSMQKSVFSVVVLLLVLMAGMLASAENKPSAPATSTPQAAPSAPPLQSHPASEIVRSHIDIAYQKALNAQKDAQIAIQNFNQAVAQGVKDEGLDPQIWTLRYDPSSESVTAIPLTPSMPAPPSTTQVGPTLPPKPPAPSTPPPPAHPTTKTN